MTKTKIVVGALAAVAVGTLVYMYVNKKGMFKVAAASNADGEYAPIMTTESKYPPHTYIKKLGGYTDSQGKLI